MAASDFNWLWIHCQGHGYWVPVAPSRPSHRLYPLCTLSRPRTASPFWASPWWSLAAQACCTHQRERSLDTFDQIRLLESKQLRANTQKSRFVVIGQQKSRTEILKDAEANPIMVGDMIIENSKSQKYLGDQIHEDGCEASITATLDGRIPSAKDKEEIIITSKTPPP